MTIQTAREEIAAVLDAAISEVEVYAYLPGAAQIPSIVVGLPDRIDVAVTTNYWEVDLPVYVISRSTDPLAGETRLLDLMAEAVAVLKANRAGANYATMRVVSVTDMYQIVVGTIEAHSCEINVSLMLNPPS